jgi:ketosteroid isomerase-like protein
VQLGRLVDFAFLSRIYFLRTLAVWVGLGALLRDTAGAMSQENVEIVRATLDAYTRGDWESAFRDAAPNFEFDLSRALGPQRGVYRGAEARHAVTDFYDSWQSVRIEPHEFIEVGEHVVVPWTAHLVGRDGIEVQTRVTWTYTFRDGAVERLCMYQEREEALEAVGLSEQEAHADS